MVKLTDTELIDELRIRFDENRKALHDLQILSETLGVMNRKLKESESLKSNFLANIRNEINNPLTAILGFSKVLTERLDPASDEYHIAEMIYGDAFNFHFQLRNILTAASLEAGDAVPTASRTDLQQLIRTTLGSFAHLAQPKGVRLVMVANTGPDEFTADVPCDAEKIQLILANLLANAIEYSPDGEELQVGLAKKEHEIVITVRDRGIGIPAGKRKQIFDRFRQLDMGICKAHRGHGLGLSVVKELVDIMGGAIAVGSAKGGGALFTVSLPVAPDLLGDAWFADSGNAFLFDADDEDAFTEICCGSPS